MNRKLHISECCFCVTVSQRGCSVSYACNQHGLGLLFPLDLPVNSAIVLYILDFSYELAQPLPALSHSDNSLFLQVRLVLVGNTKALQTLQLLTLDSFHLQAFVLNFLANLAALLEVVKALLLYCICVSTDLISVYKKVRAHAHANTNG